jgi:quercetin dioxygenase-like cupin family protein
VYSDLTRPAEPVIFEYTILCTERSTAMVIDLSTIDVPEMGGGMSVTFPFSSATGTAASAGVYIVLEPGGALPEHTDSAEEWLLVVEGTVEATVGGETFTLTEGQLAFIPALALHSAVNTSDRPVRILGFFASSTNVAHFTEPLGPDGPQVLVVGAAPGVVLPVAEPVAA